MEKEIGKKEVAEEVGTEQGGQPGKKDDKGPGLGRHLFMAVVSALIITLVMVATAGYPRMVYGKPTGSGEALVPFATCLAGVLLFIMGVSRRKRGGWSLKKYLGDHCYRIAQAFAYLFIVLWAWSKWRNSIDSTDVHPNIIGFLVGFFILRVERAMESLGEKFEEALMSILPRSVTYMTIQERRRQGLRNTYKLEEVATQYQALRPMLENKAVVSELDRKIGEATEAASGEDPEETDKKISALVRDFEDARHGINESIVPLEDLISPGIETSGEGRKPDV